MFDPQRGEIPDCIHVQPDGSLAVTPRYMRELPYDSGGLAAVWVAGEWNYVNRRGIVIITGVPAYDNGPDEFHDGLVRFVRDKKYGFANRKGEVVILPRYDGALPFENGRAKVCLGCVSKCIDRACEHHMFSGGQWLTIGKQGAILR
ncbi:MAG TPA: WG repeat-containing protein [Terriglobales bacterium]|nr:WG repeat-containing protein [Terriglobales bacterium]